MNEHLICFAGRRITFTSDLLVSFFVVCIYIRQHSDMEPRKPGTFNNGLCCTQVRDEGTLVYILIHIILDLNTAYWNQLA